MSNIPTTSDRNLAIKLVRLHMQMAREGREGKSSVNTAYSIQVAIREHVNSEIAKLQLDYRDDMNQNPYR